MRRHRSSPEASFFGFMTFVFWMMMFMPTVYLLMRNKVELSEGLFFGLLFGTMAVSCVIAYIITQWFFYWRKERPGPVVPPIGMGDGRYHAVPVPRQCIYCNTSLQPSSPMCPKCNRKN